jgi:general secretion pathway protein G
MGSAGFSMIELMFVIVIIGIIASITLPNYMRFTKRAKEVVVTENMHTLQLALEAFSIEQLGHYPRAADEAAFKAHMPRGRYPDNPFTNTETTVIWEADPVGPGEIGIFNLPGGGYRVRGHGVTGLLDDIVLGD